MVGLDFIAKTLTGAVVGYVTNDWAIDMLFRKRLGMGGIFLKTHQEFARNISLVVERDIINHHTLLSELQGAEFEKNIEATISHLFDSSLKEALPKGENRIKNIPKLADLEKNIHLYLDTQIPTLLYPALQDWSDSLTLSQILPKEQAQVLVEKVLKDTIETIQKEQDIFKIVERIAETVTQNSPETFLGKEGQDYIYEKTELIFKDLATILAQEDAQLLQPFITEIQQLFQVEIGLEAAAQKLVEKNIIQVLGKNNAAQAIEALVKQLHKIVDSEEGERIFYTFADFFIHTLEKEEKTIFELLTPEVRANLVEFFKKQFPPILVKVIGWVYSRQNEIEKLVDETFTKNVESGFKNWLVKTFVGSVSQSADVVSKIIQIIEEYRRRPEEVALELTTLVIDFLESKTVGEMVRGLKGEQTTQIFGNILRKNISESLEKLIPDDFLHIFVQKPISEFVSADKLATFLKNNLSQFIDNFKAQQLYSPAFLNWVLQNTDKIIELYWTSPIKNWLEKQTIVNFWQSNEQAAFAFFDDKIKNWSSIIVTKLYENQEGKPLMSQLSYTQKQDILQTLSQKLQEEISLFLNQHQERELDSYLQQTQKFPNFEKRLSKIIHKLLLDNLETLLENRISELVYGNLERLAPTQIRDMVEKFMGKELKPITILGAFWGGIAGGALAAVPSFEGNLALTYGVPAVSYGVTGWATNWLALKMIFRPYEKKKIPFTPFYLPFTPGVAVRNQPRFAQNMSKFVGDKLINEEGLKEAFSQNKKLFKHTIIETITQNDYASIATYLEKNNSKLAQQGAVQLQDYLQNKKEILIQNGAQWLSQGSVKVVEKFYQDSLQSLPQKGSAGSSSEEKNAIKEVRAFLHQYLTSYLVIYQKKIPAQIQDFLAPDTLLSEKIPVFLQEKLSAIGLKKVLALLEKNIQNPDAIIQKLSILLEKEIFKKTENKSLSHYLTESQALAAQERLSEYLTSQLKISENKEKIVSFIDKKISQELAPEKPINALFNGALLNLLVVNIDFIIQKMVEKGTDWIAENSEKIAQIVYERAYQEQKTAFFYKNAIKRTTLELCQTAIPELLTKESHSLSRLVTQEIERLGLVALGDLGVKLNKTYIENTVVALLDSPRTQSSVEDLASELLETLFHIPLDALFRFEEWQENNLLQTQIQSEIKAFFTHLSERYLLEKEQIEQEIGSLLQKIQTLILGQKIDLRFKQGLLDAYLNQLAESEKARQIWQESLQMAEIKIWKTLHEKSLDFYLPPTFWKQTLQQLAVLVLEEKAEVTSRLFQNSIAQSLGEILNIIPKETKDFLVQILVTSVMDSLQEKLPDLLTSINIKQVVVREIERMPAQEVEQLFQSFAQKYFDRLIQYGFGFGLGMGLLFELGYKGAKEML
ncbi:DUF445 family protein [Hugenholtzia roseola]|uniref:DUF445 family protein n=1 Tax=Hugenholtzia roseola TaxID=1002 RepID=UPI000408CBBE|nr:DUF445 family protein [Hugenholtzia roseola]